MFLNPLDRILKRVIEQPEWDKYREYSQIVKCWRQVVNKQVFQNTRPLYMDRQTLYVATSSAVWAQELALQRYSIIKKLNARLNFTIKDIRFSPARWQNKQKQEIIEIPLEEVNLNKLRAEKARDNEEEIETIDANIAIKSWLGSLKKKSQNSNTCPQCQSLTPQAELSRWQMCRYCIARQWNDEHRPPKG